MRSLRFRFLAALLFGAVLVACVGSYATYKIAQEHIQNQLVKRSKALANNINHTALLARSGADLQRVVETMLEDNKDIHSIAVILKQDQLIIASATSDGQGFGAHADYGLWRRLVDAISEGNFGFQIEYNRDLVLIAPLWQSKTANESRSADYVAPPPEGWNIHAGDPAQVGYRGAILLRVDRSDVIATMSNILWGLTPISVNGIVAMLLISYVLLHTQVISPIDRMRKVMKQQQSGVRDARAERQSARELDEVARTFNGMIDTIFEREQKLRQAEIEITRHRDELQQRVEVATRDLKTKAEELKAALAREKQLNELQRQFVSMASHEFRTPLAIIDTAAQRLKRCADRQDISPEDTVRRVAKIRSSVQRMTRLMESTLTTARMQDGNITINVAACNISRLIAECCAHHRDIASNHVINCDMEALPDTIQADAGALEQVLTNLLSNAVKYAPDAPQIDVTSRTDGDHVVISVRDHGVGIDQADQEKIGERFFRAATSAGISGTGIGLNLVKMLVELHDGELSFVSENGKGSTFTIRLPIAGPAKSPETLAEASTNVA